MSNKYYSLVTNLGNSKITNAAFTNDKVNVTHFAVGDGNGQEYFPDPAATTLKNETWRGVLESAEASTEHPNIMVFNAIIPSNVGGFTVREMGVYDADGTLIAICNTPATPKTTTSDGIVHELKLSMEVEISNAEVVEMIIDPNIVVATKKDITAINSEIEKMKAINIKSDEGAHGIRYKNSKLQLFDGSSWEDLNVGRKTQTLSISADGWQDDNSNKPFKVKKHITIDGILSRDIVTINYDKSCIAEVARCNSTYIESENGGIIIYASQVPSETLSGTLIIDKSQN